MQEVLAKKNRTLLCGIVNVTPDSFSDGGKWSTTEKAVQHALSLIQEGADMLDIGGESTRPGATIVPCEEEINRVVPVIKALQKETNVPISVDTWKAQVAEAAINAGCNIINDITGFAGDPKMPSVISKSGCGAIIMANALFFRPNHPETKKFPRLYLGEGFEHFLPQDKVFELECLPITEALVEYLKISLELAEKHGIAREKLFVDPGFGFGLTNEENITVLNHLERFESLRLPLFVGISRKRFVSNMITKSNAELADKDLASAIAASSIMGQTAILRVHSITEHKIARDVVESLKLGVNF